MNGVGGEQDSQHRNGKSDSKEDFGSEFYDTGEKSIFDGDDFELVGTYTGDSWRGKYSIHILSAIFIIYF